MEPSSQIPEINFPINPKDLNAFKQKNPRLIFAIGPHGSGVDTQCTKISNEFKYTKLILRDLIKSEITKNTPLGQQAKSSFESHSPIPNDIISNILLQAIIESKTKSIIIEGFPRTLEQALHFETHISPIKHILNFIAPEPTCSRRLSELFTKRNLPLPSQEQLQASYEKSTTSIQNVVNFYSQYGIVRTIDADASLSTVNERTKPSLFPVMYSIIGKRYSGKTTLSEVLHQHQGIECIDFEKQFKEFKQSLTEV